MTKITTIITNYDEETGKCTVRSVNDSFFDNDELDDESVSGCDDECEDCDMHDVCSDDESTDDDYEDGEYDGVDDEAPVIYGEITIDPYKLISKTLSLIALGFSAATAIKLWKKVR